MSDEKQIESMAVYIVGKYSHLDCAFNNSGVQTPQKPMGEFSYEKFDKLIAVDFKGVWNCMKFEIIQILKQEGKGSIVNKFFTRRV